jgi:hypothetical protein
MLVAAIDDLMAVHDLLFGFSFELRRISIGGEQVCNGPFSRLAR